MYFRREHLIRDDDTDLALGALWKEEVAKDNIEYYVRKNPMLQDKIDELCSLIHDETTNKIEYEIFYSCLSHLKQTVEEQLQVEVPSWQCLNSVTEHMQEVINLYTRNRDPWCTFEPYVIDESPEEITLHSLLCIAMLAKLLFNLLDNPQTIMDLVTNHEDVLALFETDFDEIVTIRYLMRRDEELNSDSSRGFNFTISSITERKKTFEQVKLAGCTPKHLLQTEDEVCCVCLDTALEVGETCAVLLQCKHRLCVNCLKQCLKRK